MLEQPQLDGLNAHIDQASRTTPTLAALLAGSTAKLPLAAFSPAELEALRTQVAEGDAALAATVTRRNERIAAENARIQAEAAAAEAAAAEAQRLEDAQAAREAAAAAEESSSGKSVSVSYPNCDAARAAGAAPL